MNDIENQEYSRRPSRVLRTLGFSNSLGFAKTPIKRKLLRVAQVPLRFVFGVPFAKPVLAVCALGFGLYAAGSTPFAANAAATLSKAAGFSVREVTIQGNARVTEEAIGAMVSKHATSSIFALNGSELKKNLLENPWLKSVKLRKVYPDTLMVDVVERQPVAFWKIGEEMKLIAKDGVALGKVSDFSGSLPQVVGEGANDAAAQMIAVASKFEMFSNTVQAFVRVADRRWNIVLKNGKVVMLPENDWQKALSEFVRLQNQYNLINLDLEAIDMRLADRLTLRLPNAIDDEDAASANAIKISQKRAVQ